MKEISKTEIRRRKRFMLQFQRYLANYLKHPGFRSKAVRTGRQQG